MSLAEKVMNKEPGAVEKYLKFLSSGGSDYPINLLKNAGDIALKAFWVVTPPKGLRP